MMRRLGLILIIVVLLAIGALAGAAFLIPASFYQQKIEQQANLILGREIRIDGPVSLRFWPNIQASAEAVSIANPDGFSEDNFATMKAMRASVALLPLLARKVEIKEFVLIEPQIIMERRRNGAVNWAIGKSGQASSRAKANAGFERKPGAVPLSASFGDVRLVNGNVKVIDRSNGKTHHLEKVNLNLKMPSLKAPMRAKGDAVFNDKAYALNATLGGLKPFLEGEKTALKLSLDTALFNVNFNGDFAESKDIVANGKLSLKVPSVRALAAASGTTLAASANTFGTFSIEGAAIATTKRFTFKNAKLRFDDIAGEGNYSVVFAGARPKLTGNFVMEQLDITPYLPPQAPPGQGSIAQWSTASFDLNNMLKLADVNVKIDLGSLKMRDITIGTSVLETALVNGRLQADLLKMALYGGKGKGRVVVNARSAIPSFSLTTDITDIAFLPLLTDSVKFKRLAGTGQANLSLLSSGNSQAEVMKRLSGTGSFHAKDGKIIGVNLAAILRSAKNLLIGNDGTANANEELATDFSDLSASFKVADGIARTDDFLLSAPILRVPGAGMVDIGGQTIDFSLTPRAVASLEGQGGKTDLAGINAPFRIHGPWSGIKAGLDKKAIKNAAKNAAKKQIGKLLSKQFGGNNTSELDADGEAADDKTVKSNEELALKAIGGLFKKKKKKDE